MENSKKKYVLVHGAWHGAWSFDKTKERLEKEGAEVLTLDLPGHGNDRTKIPDVTMDAYVQRVVEKLKDIDGKVTLVGHSLSGFVVTQVAETIPEKIEELVFVAAMVPYEEKTVFDILNEDEGGQLLQNLIFSEDKSYATVNKETLTNVVYNKATVEQIMEAAPNLVHQATQPFFAEVSTSEVFEQVSKKYIICTEDKIISPSKQMQLIDICNIQKTVQLNTGHVPQIEDPGGLAQVLMQA